MVIVIDLSRKLVGFNLFESFFYRLKNEGKLFFANNPLTVDDGEVNYGELRSHMQNILYDHHVSSYSLCVLYDMEDQKHNPIKGSMASNIHEIKENIIDPLSQEYSFDKLYYFSLDGIKRNYDGVPLDDNIRVAIDYDAQGYLSEGTESKYSDIVFTEEEISAIDRAWFAIRKENLTPDNLSILDPQKTATEFKQEIERYFKNKVLAIQTGYPGLAWYAGRLEKVYKAVCTGFENMVYKNTGSINSIEPPSELLRNALKMEVSTYRERSTVIIHVGLTDKNATLAREVLRFRHQLEIIALLIYLATNDTKLVFEGGQSLSRENHWEITTILHDENLSRMLNSYNSKLKTELDKLGKFTSNEIEYEDFAPRTFNLAVEMKKPKLPSTPYLGLFCNGKDARQLEIFAEALHNRYLRGVEYANKRIRELTTKLRIQKESDSTGKMLKGNIIEISAKLDEMQNNIKVLQQKIAFYRPKEAVAVNPALKLEYDAMVKDIQAMMAKRLKVTTFVKNILLIMGVSFCAYPLLQMTSAPDQSMVLLTLLTLLLPALVYVGLQTAHSVLLKKKIANKINLLIYQNERLVNNLFRNDNEASKYVQDIYNLIMQRKYVNECNAKVISSNRKFKQFSYHQGKLKAHAEVSDRLMEVLGISVNPTGLVRLDKLEGLESGKSAEANPVYCPLSYLMVADPIENKAIINDQQNVDIDSNLIGFVEKFIIKYDKEYRHD